MMNVNVRDNIFGLNFQVTNSIKNKRKDTIRNIKGWAKKSFGWNLIWTPSNRSNWDGIRCNSRQSQIDAPLNYVPS